jgi:seryl-tRNA synthetase
MYMQNKEDATELIEKKAALEKSKKEADELALQKEAERDSKVRGIGNYVHESVPVSNTEVSASSPLNTRVRHRGSESD